MKSNQGASASTNILLTGLPRAGTTLSCHILNQYHNVLALHEPLTPTEFQPGLGKKAAVDLIAEFAMASRQRALLEGKVLSRQKNGVVPENPVAASSGQGLRALDVSLADIQVDGRIKSPDFTLVIKHNALFTSLLPELGERFPIYAIVRNPLAVLASWNSVDLPVNQGRVPAGESYCPALKAQLDATPDRIQRQLHILEWFCGKFVNHAGGAILRYEDFVGNPAAIGQKLGLAGTYTGSVLKRDSRNQSYDLALMEGLYNKLRCFGEAIWALYSPADIDGLMEALVGSSLNGKGMAD